MSNQSGQVWGQGPDNAFEMSPFVQRPQTRALVKSQHFHQTQELRVPNVTTELQLPLLWDTAVLYVSCYLSSSKKKLLKASKHTAITTF